MHSVTLVRRLLVGATLLAATLATVATSPPVLAGSVARRAAPPGCGTWVLQPVATDADLTRNARKIRRALSHRGVRGLSVRVPWSAIDQDFDVLNRAARLAHRRGKELSVRFLAGRATPARVFREGAHFYRSGGARIPKPFGDGGKAGNPVFERSYAHLVSRLASWSRRHGVTVLHLPWYGYQWAEIYNGPAVRAARGYSYRAWLRGHLRLLDIGLRASGNGLAVEFALSGDWGGRTRASGRIADRVVDRVGPWSRRAIVQGNGMGRWNAPATNRTVFHAKQMVDGGTFDWRSIYRTLRANDEAYVEAYLSSFSAPGKRQLLRQGRAFRRDRC